MYQVEILDQDKGIISLHWEGKVTPDEVESANEALKAAKSKINKPFDLLVLFNEGMVFLQETQKKIVDHQKLLIDLGMKRAAVVTGNNSLIKMQLNRTAKQSGNQVEFQFDTFEEALEFLSQ